MAARDWSGERVGRLTIGARVGTKHGYAVWSATCDCGDVLTVKSQHLARAQVKSCGCLRREVGLRAKRHGMTNTPEFRAWQSMLDRCYNPRARAFHYYGGRGITVCKRWRDSFEAFYADLGPKPTRRLSIDRIDNDRGYAPHNCRWATPTEQARNRRRTHKY